MTSSMSLYENLKIGTGELQSGLQDLIWSSYRRQSLAIGGDWMAGFQFSEADWFLELWRDEYLGAHFVEYWTSQVAFMGRLHSMKLTYNGQFQEISIDRIFNKLAVEYETTAGTTATTTFADDSSSQAKWGVRQKVVRADIVMNATMADTYRDTLLERYKEPRVFAEEVNFRPSKGVLRAEVLGYVWTLDDKLLTSASETLQDVDDEISDSLSGADFVTEGDLENNTLQVLPYKSNESAWKRIKRLAALGDSSDNRWLAGCYQGRALDYFQADDDTIEYYYDARAREFERNRVIYDVHDAEIPAAMVLPGRVAFARDLSPGVPVKSPLLDDPRALFIERLEFSKQGLKLKNAPQDTFVERPHNAKSIATATSEYLTTARHQRRSPQELTK